MSASGSNPPRAKSNDDPSEASDPEQPSCFAEHLECLECDGQGISGAEQCGVCGGYGHELCAPCKAYSDQLAARSNVARFS